MTGRPPYLTPVDPQSDVPPGAIDASQDKASPHLAGLSASQRLIRIGAIVGALVTLVGSVGLVSRFAVADQTAKAVGELEVKIDRKLDKREEALSTHAHDEVHPKAVSRELFQEHVARFEREADRAERRDEEIIKRLDVLGEKTYRSERQWQRKIEEKDEP